MFQKGDYTRTVLILFLSVALTLCLDIAAWYISRESVTFIHQGETESLLLSDTVTAEDQSGIPATGYRIHLNKTAGVVVRFSEPLKEDTGIRLCTMRNGDEPWWYCLEHIASKGLTEWAVNLPLDNWSALRIETGDKTVFTNISVSEGTTQESRKAYPFRVGRLAVGSFVLALSFWLFLRAKQTREFKTIQEYVSRNILHPETRNSVIDILYIILTCVLLLHHVYVLLFYHEVENGSAVFGPYWIAFAVISIILGQMWRDRGFRILFVLFLLMYFRIRVTDYQAADANTDTFRIILYAFFVCYSIGHVLNSKRKKQFLQVFCGTWSFAMMLFSSLGIYVAWTGVPVQNLGNDAIWIEFGRLRMIYHPVISGILASVSIAVAMIGVTIVKSSILKGLYIIAICDIFMAEVLTSVRVASVIVACEFSLIICMYLYNMMKPSKKGGKTGLPLTKRIGLGMAFLIIVAGVTIIQPIFINQFNAIRNRGIHIVSSSIAEGVNTGISNRMFNMNFAEILTLNSRTLTWKSLLQVIKEKPRILLWGESIHCSMDPINAVRIEMGAYPVSHCHSTFLQLLYEQGIPGMLLFLWFSIHFLICAYRLICNKDIPTYLRIVPIPAIGCLIGDMVDLTSIFTGGSPQMTILYLFAGFTVALNQKMKNV